MQPLINNAGSRNSQGDCTIATGHVGSQFQAAKTNPSRRDASTTQPGRVYASGVVILGGLLVSGEPCTATGIVAGMMKTRHVFAGMRYALPTCNSPTRKTTPCGGLLVSNQCWRAHSSICQHSLRWRLRFPPPQQTILHHRLPRVGLTRVEFFFLL